MSDHGISVGEKVGERAYGEYCNDYTLRSFEYLLMTNFDSSFVESIGLLTIRPIVPSLLSSQINITDCLKIVSFN